MSFHPPEQCEGEDCVIHNPSDHHMRGWPTAFRPDRFALTERVCEHGIGHPDPDSLAWQRRMAEQGKIPAGAVSDIHGCDGCCAPSVKGLAAQVNYWSAVDSAVRECLAWTGEVAKLGGNAPYTVCGTALRDALVADHEVDAATVDRDLAQRLEPLGIRYLPEGP